MRSIPADTLCLLGMNRLDFPRRATRLSFDLLAQSNRTGDRSAREEDRQFFLETLLSARSHLYLSYQSFAAISDAAKEPSVVVEELLSYLKQAMQEEEYLAMFHPHPRQGFDAAYFDAASESLFTYDPDRAERRNRLASPPFADPFPIGTAEASAPIPEPPSEVELEELIRFFRDPAKSYAVSSAKIRLVTDEEALPNADALQQSALDRFQLRQALADAIAAGDPIDGLPLKRFAQDKLLPPGHLEALVFLEELERAHSLSAALGTEPSVDSFAQVRVEPLALSGATRLRASDQRQILVHGGELKSPRLIDAWIRHLFALRTAPGFSGETWVLTLHSGAKHIRFGFVDDPQTELQKLVELYLKGRHRPLALFPILSHACFNTWKSDSSDDDSMRCHAALEAARKTLAIGKTNSPFYRNFDWSAFDRACFGDDYAIDQSFVDLACAFWEPLEAAKQPLALP